MELIHQELQLLKYDDFICECVGAKDSGSPSFAIIQGTNGYVRLNGPANQCLSFETMINGKVESYNEQKFSNRMTYEVIEFLNIFKNKDIINVMIYLIIL